MSGKICFLVHDNLYNSKREFAKGLAGALERLGVETKTIDIQDLELDKDQITSLYRFDPEFTCSFNTMMPMEDGNFIWDAIETPHVSFLVDPAIYYLHLTKSSYSVMTYVERHDDEVLASAGVTAQFFFPHAVEKSVAESAIDGERPYDVALLGSCYDHESVRRAWEKQYPKPVQKVIERVIERTLAEAEKTFLQILTEEWAKGGIDPRTVDFQTISTYIDYYLRGFDRLELLKSIRDADVHVFGDIFWIEGANLKGWQHYLSDMTNVTVHDSVPFNESYDILRKSKICLNSTPFFKDGSHERLFIGPSTGCTVLTSENQYPREVFGEGKGIEYYRFDQRDGVNDQINQILSDEKTRLEKVRQGKMMVSREHTWDNRAEQLLQTMPDMMAEVYARTMNPN